MPKPKDAGLGELILVDTLGRIDDKIDKLDGRLDGIDKTLVKQQVILDEHVRRTNLLEQKLSDDKVARHKFIINTLKVLGVIAGTGAGGMALKEAVTWILKFWG